MARNSLLCADVPLRNYSLTLSLNDCLEGRLRSVLCCVPIVLSYMHTHMSCSYITVFEFACWSWVSFFFLTRASLLVIRLVILCFCVLFCSCFLLPLQTTVVRVKHSSTSVCLCVCLSVCLSVCPHSRTKMAETTITKLATGILHHESLLSI